MGFVIQVQYIDWEGFPTGSAHNLVGPFESKEAAKEWIDDNPAFVEENRLIKTKHGYSGGGARELRIVDPLANATRPEEWKPQS